MKTVSPAMLDVLNAMATHQDAGHPIPDEIYPSRTVLALSRRNLIGYGRFIGYRVTEAGWELLGRTPAPPRCGRSSLYSSVRCRLEPNHDGVHVGVDPNDREASVWWT